MTKKYYPRSRNRYWWSDRRYVYPNGSDSKKIRGGRPI
ncbi:hypothetical protein LEP1GSC151_3399, partial [Leptospira interrogans serovar Grippotyphosa str. LT2186]